MKRSIIVIALCSFLASFPLISAAPQEQEESAAKTGEAKLIPSGTDEAKLIPAGTEMTVRANEKIDSQTASEGQKFSAIVDQDVKDTSGAVAVPKGSEAQLVIRKASAGTFGTSELELDLSSIVVAGKTYAVSTANLQEKGREGIGKNKRTAQAVGGGAALGGIIGAIAGKGKGAALGAIIGATAGGATQVLTKGKSVKVPAEAVLTFRFDQPLRLEQQHG